MLKNAATVDVDLMITCCKSVIFIKDSGQTHCQHHFHFVSENSNKARNKGDRFRNHCQHNNK
jgi:hypothetical protein